MKLRRPAAVIAAVGIVVSACSGPALSPSAYAEVIERATDDYIERSQALSVAFQSTVEQEVALIVETDVEDPVAAAIDVTKREMVLYLALLEDAMGRYIEQLSQIAPPESLVQVHDDYVTAVQVVQRGMPETRASVESAFQLDGIEAAIAGSGLQDGQYRLAKTCMSLEAAVRAEGHGLDLGCTRPLTRNG
ncbi:MAG: hypothetical protein BMS9Abin12_0414 [Acidimicrobiia bacterium]|nr:MAG: hypothetical protein BMS9Abin12_0414 [Acidimicrobiia bacterium]